MRMFLVGMCDIFLILYLTTLGQVDERAFSPLTVSDYERLQEEMKERQKSLEELKKQLSEMSSVKTATEEAKSDLEKRIRDLTVSLQNTDTDKEKLAEEIKHLEEQKQKEEQDALSAVSTLEKELSALQRKIQDEEKAKAEKEKQLKKERLEREAEEKKLAEQIATLQKETEKKLELEKQLALLTDKNDKLAREAAEAEAEAKRNAKEAQQAKEAAALAKLSEEEARKLASTATGAALSNRVNAYLAHDDAKRAARTAQVATEEVEKTKQVLESVTQQSEEAVEQKIKPDTVQLAWELRKENVLIGVTTYRQALRLLPVRDGRDTIVLLPVSHLEIDYSESADRYREMRATIGGYSVKEMRISPDGRLAAFVIPREVPASPSRLLEVNQATGIMPTLIALRNFARLPFADRMRDVTRDFFVFNRDRLEPSGSDFRYEAKGVRGTGDYAGRILPGDTIVDLEGNIFGIAFDINRIQPVERTSHWKAVSLSGSSVDIMQKLKQHTGK